MPFDGPVTTGLVRSRHAFIPDGVDLVLGEVDVVKADEAQVSLQDGRTLDGAMALHDALRRFIGGRLVVHVAETPIQCPVAPLEFAFLADSWLRRRGTRDQADLVYATPLSGAFTRPFASEHLGGMLERRGIDVEADFLVEHVDNAANALVSYDERRIPFDLLVTVPVNMGADFVARSGLGDELNLVPVDPHTLLSRQHDNVFAVGDASDIPASKAGSTALLDGRVRGELPRPRGGPADEPPLRRPGELLRGGGGREGAAHRLQLRRRAASWSVPAAHGRPARPDEGDASQPPGEAGLPVELLERAASGKAAADAWHGDHSGQATTGDLTCP